MTTEQQRVRSPLPGSVVALWVLALSAFVIVGADLLWAVALGDRVLAGAGLHPQVPYAAAHVDAWPGPLALGEVVWALADRMGAFGLVGLHLALVTVALAVTVSTASRRGAAPVLAAVAVSLVVIGALASLVIARLPSLSLVPFVLLVALLVRDGEVADRRLVLAVPLLAIWANLHGGVLIGAALLGARLVTRLRSRPLESVLIGLGGLVALCATPSGWQTPRYYLGVFANEAARRGTDLWARPSLGNPLDLLMIAAAVVLLGLLLRSRLQAWEVLGLVGLAGLTALAARNGVWLLLLGAALVRSRSAGLRRPPPVPARPVPPSAPARGVFAVVVGLVLTSVLASWLVARRGAEAAAPGRSVVAAVSAAAGSEVVLAVEPLAETLLADSVRVWAGNPIDAFDRPVQQALLDFLHHGRIDRSVITGVGLVVTTSSGVVYDGVAADPAWRPVTSPAGYAFFVPVS